jgi:hypothetical protein
MGAVKNFRMSTSLRSKVYDLLSRYDPSDISYTIGGAIYDRMNKMQVSSVTADSAKERSELKKKKDCYFKAAKRFLSTAQSLKMLEMQYFM